MAAKGTHRNAQEQLLESRTDGEIAKLSRPRLHGAVPRERLYGRLDALRAYPVVWVSGPPGGGKTTLVADYLRLRRFKSLWYQLDGGDADVSSFFLYLARAVKRLAPRQPSLPLLTPEYLSDLPGFTRRYFRELMARMPRGSVLVLDNFHEVPGESAFHDVLLMGLREIPADRNCIVISRGGVQARYTQALASGAVQELSWPELRLTLEEASAICTMRQPLPAATLRTLHESCDGWAAGLVLMLQRADLDTSPDMRFGLASREAVFEYFASTFFEQLSPQRQHAMLLASVVPTVSATAVCAVAADQDAAGLLEDLYRRHLFVQRIGGNEPVYRLHGLFQAFLQARAATQLTPAELDAARARAARICESAGDVEQAMNLWRASADWNECARLALEQAQRLFAQGRWQTLMEWISVLPDTTMHASPWLGYWLGMCRFQTDQSGARAMLSEAYARFEQGGDKLGQMLTAASILIGYYLEYADWEHAEPWIFRLGSLLEHKPGFPTPEMEMMVYSGMLYGIAIRRPDHALLPACIERTVALIERDLQTNARMLAGLAITGPVACMLGDFSLFYRVRRMMLPLLEDPTLTELNRAAWHMTNGAKLSLSAEFEGSYEELDLGASLGARYNLPQLEFLSHAFASLHSSSYLDLARAERSLRAMQRVVNPARPLERFHLLISEGAWETLNGRHESAVQRYNDALLAAETVGGAAHRLVNYVFQCGALALAGRIKESEALALEGLRFGRECQIQTWSACFVFAQAWCRHEMGDHSQSDQLLAQAIDVGDDGSFRYFRWMLQGCRKMLAVALQRGIRTESVLKIIKVFRYASPDPLLEAWPWPVKVRTLGRFEIELHGSVLRHGRKTPRRLLALLQYLIASGGQEVSEHRIADALWPDAEGDEARQRLKLSLHRLRHLLGDTDGTCIVFSGGKVTINEERVWVDALCLKRARQQLSPEAFAHAVLELCHGEFLQDEAEEPWVLALRSRVRSWHLQALQFRAAAQSDTEKTSPVR